MALFSLGCSEERDLPDGAAGGTANTYCSVCHGSATNAAPPFDTQGNSETSARGVGAHQSHLVQGSLGLVVSCSACHVVPEDMDHADDTSGEKITFGGLAVLGGLTPTWNGTTCANTYCHGATMPGGFDKTPNWTTVDGSQKVCASCHGVPPVSDGVHDASWSDKCHLCHTATIAGPDPHEITDPTKHINGEVDLD